MSPRFSSNDAGFSEPKSGIRVSMDALMHASVVDLFGAYGVAYAPSPRGPGLPSPLPDVTVTLGFRTVGGGSGKLTLSAPSALLEQMKAAETTSLRLDWARELGNQLAGRVKNRLLPFGVRLELSPVALLDSKMLQRQLSDLSGVRVYTGRTTRGLVLVTALGLPEDSALAYVGAPNLSEGTMVWL